jgi:hypothetical protein
MALVVAEYFFNPTFEVFIRMYDKCYGEKYCPNVRNSVIPQYEKRVKPKPKYADFFMKRMIESFSNPEFVKLVKNYDTFEELILNREKYHQCTFLRDLQLKNIWVAPKEQGGEDDEDDEDDDDDDNNDTYKDYLLKDNDRRAIFKNINRLLLICQVVTVFPNKVIEKIDEDAKIHAEVMQDKTSGEIKRFDFGLVKRTGLEILGDIKDYHIGGIFAVLGEFCMSDCTPIFAILPKSLHQQATNLRNMWKVPAARRGLMKQLKPFLRTVQSIDMFQQANEKYRFDMGEEEQNGFNSNNSNSNTNNNNGTNSNNTEQQQDAEYTKKREQTIQGLLEFVMGLIDRHEQLVLDLAINPQKALAKIEQRGFQNVMKDVIDVVNEESAEMKQMLGTATAAATSTNNGNSTMSSNNAVTVPPPTICREQIVYQTAVLGGGGAVPVSGTSQFSAANTYSVVEPAAVVNDNYYVQQDYFDSMQCSGESSYY